MYYVVALLKNDSLTTLKYSCDICIGDLYVVDYYDQPVVFNYQPLGLTFASHCPVQPFIPLIDELEQLTTKLKHYLIAQGLKITYISHCNINIAWS